MQEVRNLNLQVQVLTIQDQTDLQTSSKAVTLLLLEDLQDVRLMVQTLCLAAYQIQSLN